MKIILRAEAKALGLLRYYTGRPCLNGHVSERQTSNGSCLLCHALMLKMRAQDPVHRESIRISKAKSRLKNISYVKAYAKNYRDNDKSGHAERFRRWHQQASAKAGYREKKAAATRQWAKKNPGKARALGAIRRGMIRRTSLTELDRLVLKEAGKLARERSELFGFRWDVDHSIPLRAKAVSGLHCAANIQVIPAWINATKRNRLIFTEPFDWMRVATNGG